MKRRDIVVDLITAAFIALIIKVMASSSVLIPWNSFFDNICIIFAICVMLAKLCSLTLRIDRLMMLGIIFVLALYTCVTIKRYDMLVTMVAICLLIDEDLEKYVRLMLKVQAALLIAHIAVSGFLSLIGYANRYWYTADDRLRFNGGFSHPNVLSCMILSCILMFVWLHFRRITPSQFIWMTCIAFFSFLTSRSRTGLVLNLLLLLIIYITQHDSKLIEKALDLVLPLLFPALTAMFYVAQRLYLTGNGTALLLNDLLSSRIKLAAYAYARSGTSWLPRYVEYFSTGYIIWTPEWKLNSFTFDCLYSYLFIQMGIIWIVVITILFAFVTRKCDFKTKLFILFWILFSCVEVHGLNCFTFFPLLLLTTLISGKRTAAQNSR